MTDIDEIWQDLELDLSEAEQLIETLEGLVDCGGELAHLPGARLAIPYPVAEAYVYRGETLLRAWRKYLGLSHEELGERSGIGLSDLFRMERTGKIPPADCERLATAMGISQGCFCVGK